VVTHTPEQPADAAEEQQQEFEVILESPGDRKIEVIKAVRELTRMGLKEAKDFVEAAPKRLLGSVNQEDAETVKAYLEAAGAEVTLKGRQPP
jgi:large subunit ribosomal protein L7/L12